MLSTPSIIFRNYAALRNNYRLRLIIIIISELIFFYFKLQRAIISTT